MGGHGSAGSAFKPGHRSIAGAVSRPCETASRRPIRTGCPGPRLVPSEAFAAWDGGREGEGTSAQPGAQKPQSGTEVEQTDFFASKTKRVLRGENDTLST